MTYNIFNSEPMAEQEIDYQKFISDLIGDNTRYLQVTCCWAIPFQRITDNKWVYPKYSNSNQSFTEEEFNPLWVSSEE